MTQIITLIKKSKVITSKLAILAHAAVTQTVIVRTMSNKQFEKIKTNSLDLRTI